MQVTSCQRFFLPPPKSNIPSRFVSSHLTARFLLNLFLEPHSTPTTSLGILAATLLQLSHRNRAAEFGDPKAHYNCLHLADWRQPLGEAKHARQHGGQRLQENRADGR